MFHKEEIKRKTDTGITLVALVVTIIILIILAGVSISMVLGENGLIAKAKYAKEQTEKASIKERLDIALAQWKIENAVDNKISLKDFLEDESKSGLHDAKIITEASNPEEITTGTYNNKMFIVNADGTVIVMNSKNLVNNGFLENKDNSNFPDFIYDEKGYLTKNVNGQLSIYSSDYIEVDTNKKYFQSITAKTDNPSSYYLIGFIEYDKDKNVISPCTVMYMKDSLTYLEKDLKNGDTEIYVNSLNGFKVGQKHQMGVIFWNYKDSSGYQYPELTYSQNVYPRGDSEYLFDENGLELENNKIQLKEPWNNGTILKGTKLSQKNSGNTANYGLVRGSKIRENWKTFTNYIGGINNDGDIHEENFRYGTKYIRIYIRINYNQSIESTTDIRDIIFAECE